MNERCASLAKGSPVVCLFVNDECDRQVSKSNILPLSSLTATTGAAVPPPYIIWSEGVICCGNAWRTKRRDVCKEAVCNS